MFIDRTFLRKLEKFMAKHGLSAHACGVALANDARLVYEVREGRCSNERFKSGVDEAMRGFKAAKHK